MFLAFLEYIIVAFLCSKTIYPPLQETKKPLISLGKHSPARIVFPCGNYSLTTVLPFVAEFHPGEGGFCFPVPQFGDLGAFIFNFPAMTRCLVLRVPKDTWGSWPLCYTPQACVVLPILSLLTKQPGRVKLLPAEAAWLVLSRTSLQFRRDHDSITVCTKNKTPGSHSPA